MQNPDSAAADESSLSVRHARKGRGLVQPSTSSILHCGECDAACLGGQECVNGECVGTPTGGPITQPATPEANAESEDEDGGCVRLWQESN